MDIIIEQSKDCLELAKLNESVQSIHHRLYPENFKKFDLRSATNFFERILVSTDSYAFVAKVDSQPVGYILCMLQAKKENEFQYERKILYIDQISVNKEFRKQQIGKMLTSKAFDLAKELKVAEIHLEHWTKNEEANAFFKSLGFEYYNSKMKISV